MSNKPEKDGRWAAARVLSRVLRDDAFAAAALDAELERLDLEPREAGLATELVYGTLRSRGYLLERLAAQSRTGKLIDHPEARAHLLIGAYSLLLLSRIPDHAAVSEAVSGVRKVAGEGPARFANAVLRGLARENENGEPPSAGEITLRSTPSWLREALAETLGEEEAVAYLTAGPIPPPIGVAVLDPTRRDEVRARFTEAGIETELSERTPHGILMRAGASPRRIDGFERDFIQQEEGAQLAALSLGVQPGDRVLDACAGRGNKSLLLASTILPNGQLHAVDKYPRKLSALAGRSQLPIVVHAVDWLLGTGDIPAEMDRILVDAPCSGVGTLRRRPDILLRPGETSAGSLQSTQIAIALRAATRARDGARLVYCVCSVLREECEDVVDALVTQAGEVRLEPVRFEHAGLDALAAGRPSLRLLPHVHGTDGYFLASFVVTRAGQFRS